MEAVAMMIEESRPVQDKVLDPQSLMNIIQCLLGCLEAKVAEPVIYPSKEEKELMKIVVVDEVQLDLGIEVHLSYDIEVGSRKRAKWHRSKIKVSNAQVPVSPTSVHL